jgi:hypothetical protein
MGWAVNATPPPLCPQVRDPVHILQDARWVSGPIWTGLENFAPIGIRFWTVHPVASRYTDWAIPTLRLRCSEILYVMYSCFVSWHSRPVSAWDIAENAGSKLVLQDGFDEVVQAIRDIVLGLCDYLVHKREWTLLIILKFPLRRLILCLRQQQPSSLLSFKYLLSWWCSVIRSQTSSLYAWRVGS